MDEKYIELKIKNCQGLVETATSEAQKEIYQGYLEFWQERLGKPEPEVDVDTAKEPEELTLEQITKELPKEELLEHPELQQLIDDPTIIHEELRKSYEELFKLEYPGKQTHYIRDGQKLKTRAFKAFLTLKNDKPDEE